MTQDKDIQRLVDAFYEGSLQADEEAILRQFFSGEVPPQWQEEQRCFLALSQATEAPIPEALEARLEAGLTAHIQAKAQTHSLSRRPKARIFYRLAGAAALLLLCWTLWTVHRPAPQLADTYEDPIEAAMAAQEILALVSIQLNKGLAQWNEAKAEFHHTQELVKQHLQQ
jgi:hypothetical protein